VRDADLLDVPRGRLRAQDLTAPFRGVRVPVALIEHAEPPQKFVTLCTAYRSKLAPHWFFSHATAARLLGIPVPRRHEVLEVHVSSTTPHERPRGRWVRGHSAPTARFRMVCGHRVREPAELWCELASVLTLDELVQAGDRIVAERPFPLATLRELAAAVRKHGRRVGAKKLKLALPLLRENVWSPRETRVRLVMLRAGLPEAENNKPIFDRSGTLVAIGDLVLERWMTVVEYEGERWHRDPWSGIDVDRYNALSRLGWTIVKIRKHHTRADIERLIREALVANGWRG
jgi:hypothetical protein